MLQTDFAHPFDAFTRDNIKGFISWMKNENYAPKIINLKVTAIRSFLKFCSEEDFESRGIYTEVCSTKKVKEEKYPIVYLQPTSTSAILSAYTTDTIKHRRNRMMLIMLLDSRPHWLSTDSISLVLKTVADKARETCSEVPDRVYCHMMRKTKAMDLYKSGVPPPFIMQLLGHESMSTTSGFYAFATLEMMSDAMNKATPSIDNEEKLWKKEEIKNLLYSLDYQKYYAEEL